MEPSTLRKPSFGALRTIILDMALWHLGNHYQAQIRALKLTNQIAGFRLTLVSPMIVYRYPCMYVCLV